MSVAGSTAVIAAMAFTDDMAAFFILNLLAGLGLIVRWVTCDTWIVTIAPVEARGRAIGMHETLMGLGIALGPLLLSLTGTSGTLPFLTWVRRHGTGIAAAAPARPLEPAA